MVIHRYWTGPDPAPDNPLPLPTLDWRDEDIPRELNDWIEARTFHVPESRLPWHRSNLLRLWLLWHHGGVWLDYDLSPRSLPHHPFVGWYNGQLVNGAMGFPAHHPFVGAALTALNTRTYFAPNAATRTWCEKPVNVSGANFLTLLYLQNNFGVAKVPFNEGGIFHHPDWPLVEPCEDCAEKKRPCRGCGDPHS